jgi:hypothetical protein
VYKINAFDPNIVESRGTTAGGLAGEGAVVVGARGQGARRKRLLLSEGSGLRFAAASVLCAPKIPTLKPAEPNGEGLDRFLHR